MMSPRPAKTALRAFYAVSVVALMLIAPRAALAQGKLEAYYEATLSGIAVGGTSGLLKTFASGSGSGSSQGRIVAGALVPSGYSATSTTSKKSEAIRMVLVNGAIKEFSIEPQPPVDPDRLPITEAHKRGVLDPMTGSMIRVPGSGDPLSAEACRGTAAVFDGRMRYDLKLEFKRMENVKAEKGYHGPVVVCAVYFTPIAGYIPDRPVIKYLSAQRNIEIAFAPVAGTRVLVPFWMKIPTPLGPAMLQATQFITQATPPRVAKTQ